jgi:hypothetical protein
MVMFVIRNHNIYQANNAIHHICTRQFEKLHVSSARLSLTQRGVLYSSITIYNNLPHKIQNLKDNVNIFRHTLKKFLISNTFYSIMNTFQAKFCWIIECIVFVIIDNVPKSYNGVQMSFVILNLFVIVIDSISGPDRTTDQ